MENKKSDLNFSDFEKSQRLPEEMTTQEINLAGEIEVDLNPREITLVLTLLDILQVGCKIGKIDVARLPAITQAVNKIAVVISEQLE